MANARELTSRLIDLLRHEQGAMADFLVALAEFDTSRHWIELGYTSLFHFLHRELGMSKGAAHYRKTAAELIQRVPEIVEPLRKGALCITSIIELAKVVTPENRMVVLPRFLHCSRQEAKAVSAELCPAEAAPHRTVVTAPFSAVTGTSRMVTAASGPSVELPLAGTELDQAVPALQDPAPVWGAGVQPVEPRKIESPVAGPVAASRTTAEPLTADLRRLHVTVSKRFLAKLEAARDALSHSHPGADIETILAVGLDLVIERHAKRKGLVAKPRALPPGRSHAGPSEREDSSGRQSLSRTEERGESGGRETPARTAESRYIPAHVKRGVWIRDQGCCQWKLGGGGICGSTVRLQFDQILPVARGGTSTVSNIRVLCASHNSIAQRRVFGDALMDRFAPARPPAALLDSR